MRLSDARAYPNVCMTLELVLWDGKERLRAAWRGCTDIAEDRRCNGENDHSPTVSKRDVATKPI